MCETARGGQAMPMILFIAGGLSLLYLLFWPFSLRLDARLSPTCGRGELTVASLLRLRLEGDFLQPPCFSLHRLTNRGRRPFPGRKGQGQGSFFPVLHGKRLWATLYVGVAADGALTVETLGIVYALLEAAGSAGEVQTFIHPTPCFDKNICALRLFGIGRFVLAQNIFNYLKGKNRHAKR